MPAPVIARDRRDASVQLARPGVQGRGDPAAERKPDRRPHGRGRSRRDPRVARGAARGDRRAAVATSCSPRIAATARPATTCRRAPRASAGCAPSRSACSPRPTRRKAAALAKAQFDARRQHDRPPGRARRPGVARRARAAGRARRLLRALPRRPAGARQMVRAAGRGAARRTRVDQVLQLAEHPDFTMANPNRLRSLAGTFGGNHWAFHSRRRPRLRLPRRHDPRRRQAQPAGRGAAGAAVRPLAAVRAEARRADARRRSSGSSRRRACRRTCSSRPRRASPSGSNCRSSWRPRSRPGWRRG